MKILDFGIARLREAGAMPSATQTGNAMGTPAFMPPEQALGHWHSVAARTDIWAVGATMFTLLTGQYVHDGSTVNETLVFAATRRAPPLSSVLPDAPEALCQLVDRALAFDREQRWQSAQQMLQRLSDVYVTLPASAVEPVASAVTEVDPGRVEVRPPPTTTTHALEVSVSDHSLRRRLRWALVGAFALVGAGSVYFAIGSGAWQAPTEPEEAPLADNPVLEPSIEERSPANSEVVAIALTAPSTTGLTVTVPSALPMVSAAPRSDVRRRPPPELARPTPTAADLPRRVPGRVVCQSEWLRRGAGRGRLLAGLPGPAPRPPRAA